MSTRVEDRKESKIQFLATMQDLVVLVWFYMGKCPKHSRFIYQTKICDVANDCYIHLQIANTIFPHDETEKKQKRGHLLEALGLLNSLEALLSIVMSILKKEGKDNQGKRYIEDSAFERIGKVISEERGLICGVLKNIS